MFQEAVLNKHFPWKVMMIYDRVTVLNLMFPQQWPWRVWSSGFSPVYSPDFMVMQPRRPRSSVRLLLGNPRSDRISKFLSVVDILYEWSPCVMPHKKWKNVREHSYVCFFFSFAVKTGSFVYDVNIGLDNWQPSKVRISMCAPARASNRKYIGLARMKSLVLKIFWEPVNVENELKWRVFNTLYIRFQN
jgi:hypothetical protein